jgi:hypothetical protein
VTALCQYIFHTRMQENPDLVHKAIDLLLSIDNRNTITDPSTLLTHLTPRQREETIKILVDEGVIRRPNIALRPDSDFNPVMRD